MENQLIKVQSLEEFKNIDAPYSDIQGIAMCMAQQLNRDNSEDIEEYLLQFYNDKIDKFECIELIRGLI